MDNQPVYKPVARSPTGQVVPETLESALNDLTPSEADWWSSADVDGDCSVNSV